MTNVYINDSSSDNLLTHAVADAERQDIDELYQPSCDSDHNDLFGGSLTYDAEQQQERYHAEILRQAIGWYY